LLESTEMESFIVGCGISHPSRKRPTVIPAVQLSVWRDEKLWKISALHEKNATRCNR
jgi:hypothetical protein